MLVVNLQFTSKADAISPEILPYEIGNALSAMVKRNKLTKDEGSLAFEAIKSIPVRLVSIDIQQALKLALEYNIYAYDAYFFAVRKTIIMSSHHLRQENEAGRI